MKSNTEVVPIQGRKSSIKSLELQKAGVELFTGSLKSLEDSAKALLVLEPSLLTAYMGVLVFFKVNEMLEAQYITEGIIIILFTWLLSVVYTFLAFAPSEGQFDLNCVSEIEETLYNLSDRKQKCLRRGFGFFIAFILLSIGILWFGTTL